MKRCRGDYASAQDVSAHQPLLGNPDTIQDDMRQQCQLVSHGITDSDDRVHLTWSKECLTGFCSANRFRMQRRYAWANNGMLYYWIKARRFAGCRFEQSWLVLQAE